jgi:hypothetical protein
MNDLTELRNLGRDLDRSVPGPSPGLRNRVLSAFAEPPRPARPLRTRRAAIAGGLAVAAGLATVPWWGGTPAVDAQAAQILDQAASVARRQPTLTARPSQFVFIKELMTYAGITDNNGKPAVQMHQGMLESWYSASGTRAGQSRWQPRSAPLPGHPTGPWSTSKGSTPHPPDPPAYLPDLPTSADAMLRYLYQHSDGSNPPDQQAFITAGDLIRANYIRPAALAAVFEAVARIPGVSVVHGAVTADGRRGIAVQRTFAGESQQLIFDRATHAFIGERVVITGPPVKIKPGTVGSSTTILRIAIVNQAGQQPKS